MLLPGGASHGFGRVAGLVAAGLVALALASPAAAQELREIPAEPSQESDLLDEILGGKEATLGGTLSARAQSRWLRIQGYWRRDDRLAAGSASADLLDFLASEGIRHAPALADAALAEGRREERAGRYSQAVEAYRLAAALDSDLAAARWREARLTFEMGGKKSDVFRLAFQALTARWAQPWSGWGELLRLARFVLIALALSGAAVLVVLLAKRGGSAAAGLGAVLPHRWHLAWRKLLGWSILLAPLVCVVFGLWALLLWPVLLAPALRRPERQLLVAWLLVLVVLAPLSGALGALEAVPNEPTSRILLDASRGTLRTDVVPALVGAVRAAPNEALPRVLLADALDRAFPDRAIQLLRQAARLAPRDPRVRVAIGNVLFRVGKKEAAGVAYREALQIDSEQVIAPLNLAKVRLASFAFEEAESLRRAAIEADESAVIAIEKELAEDEVADPVFPESEARAVVRGVDAGSRVKDTLLRLPPLSLAALAAMLGMAAARIRVPRPRYALCESCGVVYDSNAVGPDVPEDTCSACHQLLIRMEGLSPEAREGQTRRIHLHHTLRGQGRALAQLVWPGLALVHEERYLLGSVEATLFALLALLALVPAWPLAGGDVAPLWVPGRIALVLLALSWVLFQLPGFRPQAARHSGRR